MCVRRSMMIRAAPPRKINARAVVKKNNTGGTAEKNTRVAAMVNNTGGRNACPMRRRRKSRWSEF